jgi:hypothetical protein
VRLRWGGSGIRPDQEDLLFGDLAVDRHHDVRETDAGDDLHLVFLDEFVDDLLRQVGLELAVLLMICTGTPPSLPPLRSTTSMNASYWSTPSAP